MQTAVLSWQAFDAHFWYLAVFIYFTGTLKLVPAQCRELIPSLTYQRHRCCRNERLDEAQLSSGLWQLVVIVLLRVKCSAGECLVLLVGAP